jgi:glutamate-1-semialdehyde 2,1-aminomutase
MAASRIEAEYARRLPASAAFAERARRVCPGGVSQLFRETRPFPPCYERAAGSRKWTIDGHAVVDYTMGHGSLILGHRDPDVEEAIRAQLARGSHFANLSAAEIELAELVCELVPSAERVRFCSSGSEAVMYAIRLARAATGKNRFIKFEGHYHGWHDHTLVALKPPYERPATAGVPSAVREQCVVLPPNDTAALERALAESADIACVIVEPAGGTHGTVPTSDDWVRALRRITAAHGVLLVFDEMVSGFRMAPGGYQGWSGVVPDLTTLGKALFGGQPGAALAGSAAVMDLAASGAQPFVPQFGSWNAFPVACAAGVAAVRKLSDGAVQARIAEVGGAIRAGMNRVLAERGVAARVYGRGSHIHFHLRAWPLSGDSEVPPAGRHAELAPDPELLRLFRLAMFVHGVDVDFGNNVSAVHGEAEVEQTVAAFAAAIDMLIESRLLAAG